MLKWCSHGQKFLQEIPPYRDLGITHGVCRPCELKYPDLFTKSAIQHGVLLRHIFEPVPNADLVADISDLNLDWIASH